ncbi:putative ATP-grasp-modified RiPP [Streptomyces sp. 21So2-11]|uniref:putative ATP-grasp-modified RiPP n=1 Tax=Streptomyces sp. 21So2-11 TaxID=3144408 RepID=UPI00321BB236
MDAATQTTNYFDKTGQPMTMGEHGTSQATASQTQTGDVTAIETDAAAAERARKALAAAGYAPTLITADGLRGYPDRAPYDIAFCSMRHVPYGLLQQIKAAGTLLVTLAGWGFGHGLVRLTVEADGVAEGRFLPGYTSFMIARPHDRPPHGPFELLPWDERPSRIDPALLDDWTGRFVAQLAAPSAERLGAGAEQILLDVATGSQARTRAADDGEGWTTVQRGPLHLWTAIEDSLMRWQSYGSPHLSEFGMAITPDTQKVWLDGPHGASWTLPI